MRLTDHYNFRSVREPDIGPPNQKPKALDDTGTWVNKFFDQDDIQVCGKGDIGVKRFVARSRIYRWVNQARGYRQAESVLD